MLGQTQNFSSPVALLAYCDENPTLQAGYSPTGNPNPQVLDCTEWPTVLPPTGVTVAIAATPSTTSTCFQLFGATEPCIGGVIGQYTLLALIAVGIGIYWYSRRRG